MSPFIIFAVSTLSWQPDLICTLLKKVFRVENLRQDNMSLFPLCHITFKNVVCLFTDDLFASRHWQLRPYLRSHRLFTQLYISLLTMTNLCHFLFLPCFHYLDSFGVCLGNCSWFCIVQNNTRPMALIPCSVYYQQSVTVSDWGLFLFHIPNVQEVQEQKIWGLLTMHASLIRESGCWKTIVSGQE